MNEQEAHKLAQQIAIRLATRLASILLEPSDLGRQIVIHLSPGSRQVRIQWPPEVEHIPSP